MLSDPVPVIIAELPDFAFRGHKSWQVGNLATRQDVT